MILRSYSFDFLSFNENKIAWLPLIISTIIICPFFFPRLMSSPDAAPRDHH